MNLPDFSKAAVLVIGDIMLDRYWFGDAARISPEAPVPVVKIKQSDDRPGGAGNVAINIAALGTQVSLIGVTGKDDAAKTLLDQLTAANVKHSIQQCDAIPTITKLRIISRQQQLLRLDFEENFPAFNQESLINSFKTQLAHTKYVILSDYKKGTLTCPLELIKIAKAANAKVLVDPKGTDYSIYYGAEIITPNFKEFEAIVGPCSNEQEVVQKGQELLRMHHINALLLTRGEHGMTLIQRDQEEIHLPAHAREVFDVTGAGDTVIGILAAALAANAELTDAMYLANLAASLVVAKLGAATVSVSELEAAITQTEVPMAGILNEDQLVVAFAKARHNRKRIVFTNGCFDILHAGHIKYLQQAKKLGDYLIVALNDDNSITRLKGSGRPINTIEHRMTVLASLGFVDWVTWFSDDTPERLLKKLQPDILVKGGDYSVDQVVGAPIVFSYGGDVRVLGITKNISTTSIIDRMVKSTQVEAI